MKKKFKQILFVIPIFLGIIIATDVKAENVCSSESQSTSRQVTVKNNSWGGTYSITGVHGTAIFYTFSLDGVPALCLDAGKPLNSGKFFLKSNSPIDNIYIKKAYAYIQKYPNDIGKRFVAQIVTWAARKGFSDFTLPVKEGFSYYAKSMNVAEENGLAYLSELLNMNVNGLQLYVWEKPGSGFQTLASEWGSSDKPCNSSCSLEIVNELAVCNGNGNSNSGTAYQQSVGNCSKEYDSSSPNTVNYYGKLTKKFGTYCGMYCLEAVVEEFPGNIATAVEAGRYIVWPNNNNKSSNNKKIAANLPTYPLKLQFKKTCKILVDNNKIVSNYSSFEYYDVSGNRQTGQTIKTIRDNKKDYHKEAIENECSTLKQDYDDCKSGPSEYMSHGIGYGNDSTCGGTSNNPGVSCVYVGPNCSTEEKKLNTCKAYKAAYEHANSVISDFNSCINANITNEYGNIDINISSNYNDPKYGGDFNLMMSDISNGCDNCTSSIDKITDDPQNITSAVLNSLVSNRKSKVEARNIVTSTTREYDLKDGYYYYVNKLNNTSVHTITGNIENYSTIGFSNMPISFDAKVGTKNSNYYYNLNLKININTDNPFASILNSQNYTCHYKVKDNNNSCKCPEGTDYDGKDLYCEINAYNEKYKEEITCSDGQKILCDASSVIEEPVSCPPDDCPTDSPKYNTDYMRNCVFLGGTYNSCLPGCYDVTDQLTCPDDPEGITSMTEKYRDCVQTKMSQGLNKEEAKKACLLFCESKNAGIKIIYRTISLSNPFPSYDADAKITQSGLKKGMFNDNIFGRYPGSNWNSEKIVKQVILNNRGVDGDEVYNKTPLYTFVLNSKTIKEIRKYNKKNDYDDFKLSCKKNNSSACVSSFVHNTSLSGLQTSLTYSTCGGKLTSGNFYTCADKKDSMGNPV